MARALAAIDVGSTATRLRMVRLCPSGIVIEQESRRYGIALGSDVYRFGQVGEQTAQSFLDAFGDIAHRLRRFGVTERRAVATASLRDACNRDAITQQVYDAHGIHIDVISGTEESELARSALVRALGFVESESLLVDLGGGSLELMGADEERGTSVAIGTLRLAELFPGLGGRCALDEVTAARQHLLRLLVAEGLTIRPSRCIGTGGNLRVLARLLPGAPGLWPRIDLDGLDALIEELCHLDAEQRVERYGVRPDRAESLLPVAVVLQALRHHYHLSSIMVPGTGIREALLHALASRSPEIALAEQLDRSGVDPEPPRQRAQLAVGLFRLLAPVHGLWPSALPTLEVAAHGWELGRTIGSNDPLRHGVYLIRHLESLELSDDARTLAVAVFRHARGVRSPMRELDPNRHRAARVLGAILEVASRAEAGAKPEDLRADLTGTQPWVEVGVPAQRRWPRLERALGRRLEIT
ncbi:MAG: hypothetical protein AAFP04_02170 [Myxococcota bacterium]